MKTERSKDIQQPSLHSVSNKQLNSWIDSVNSADGEGGGGGGGGGRVLLSCLKMFFFAQCVFCISFLLFVPPLNISLSHPGCRNGTRSHPPATLYIRLSPQHMLCNATLQQHHFVVWLFSFMVLLDWVLAHMSATLFLHFQINTTSVLMHEN